MNDGCDNDDHDHTFAHVAVEDPDVGTFLLHPRMVGGYCTICQTPAMLPPDLVHGWAMSHRAPRLIWIDGWPQYPGDEQPRDDVIRFFVGDGRGSGSG